ncbi:MAG: hypothetical protein ACLU84_01395 [Clostridia bacterium]
MKEETKKRLFLLFIVCAVWICIWGFIIESKKEKRENDNIQEENTKQEIQGTKMTVEQIEEFNVFFQDTRINGFMNHTYDQVKNINIKELLYDGAGIGEPMTKEEYTYLMETKYDGVDIGMDSLKFKKEAISEFYTKYTEEKLEGNVGGINLTYCEKYDFYYHMHGDTHMVDIQCIDGVIDEQGYHHISYLQGEQTYTIVLKKEEDGNYIFIFNTKNT